ncbi:MAG: oligopeptide/dipeptide ABC transporter ATP-binding protein [Acidimicrobiales bacterium]
MAGTGKAHLRSAADTLLRAEDLVVEFPVGASGDVVHAVSGISIDLIEGETLGLVGESGCGKSTTGKAMMQVPQPTSGSVVLDQVELTKLDDETLRRTRPVLQMIFQDPISALNPRRTVRDIIGEPLMIWWEEEGGRPPTSIWFEWFGRFFQRVAAVAVKPLRYVMPLALVALVLWVVSEAAEGRRLEDQLGWLQVPARIIGFPVLAILVVIFGVLFLLGVVWVALAIVVPFGVVSRVLGTVSNLVGLLGAAFALAVTVFMVYRTWNSLVGYPAWILRVLVMAAAVILAVWFIAALLKPARAGASGIAAALVALVGLEVFYIAGLDGIPKLLVLIGTVAVNYALFRVVRRQLKARRDELRARAEPRVREMLETVGMNADQALDRKPYEFSGGQAQRLSIARALIMNPKVIICDEPVSALDVSVQAQILNLLEDMKQRYGLTLVFIAHDLAVVKNVSDRVAVMYLGKICEVAKPDTLYAAPTHHYSKLLLSAIPHPDPLIEARVTQIAADLPSPINPPSGCRFRTRCPAAQDRCAQEEPEIRKVDEDHYVACHFPDLSNLNGRGAAAVEQPLSGHGATPEVVR